MRSQSINERKHVSFQEYGNCFNQTISWIPALPAFIEMLQKTFNNLVKLQINAAYSFSVRPQPFRPGLKKTIPKGMVFCCRSTSPSFLVGVLGCMTDEAAGVGDLASSAGGAGNHAAVIPAQQVGM